MDKREAIGERIVKCFVVGTVAIVALVIGVIIGVQEKQQYALNAYNLGIAEYVGLENMPQEESAEFQRKIQEIVNSELSLKEQEEARDEIFAILSEYSDINIILPKEQ